MHCLQAQRPQSHHPVLPCNARPQIMSYMAAQQLLTCRYVLTPHQFSRARERLFSEEKEGLLQRIEELKDDIDSFRVATRPVPPAATSAK